MAIPQLVAKFEDGALNVYRGELQVVHQPFFPATGDLPRRDWEDQDDAFAYWETVKDQFTQSGLTSEQLEEYIALQQAQQ